MSLEYLRATVSFDEAMAERIDKVCSARGISRRAFVRTAIHDFLEREAGSSANLNRIAMMSEFTQVAVDILIREQAPDRREDILATVQERMERYHA